MGFDSIFHDLNLTLEVFFLDLLLSGDNAMLIALACRSLPPVQMRRAMILGTAGAILLRDLLAVGASFLLYIPLLKLVGGVALAVIAIKLTIVEEQQTESDSSSAKRVTDIWSAVGTIVVADLVMSVDNVLALAAVSQGSIVFLTLGLLISVPMLMFGSLFISALLRRYPMLIRGGGAMLGWFAGDIAISDAMISDWVNQQAPALLVAVPILTAVFVLIESRIMEQAQATAAGLRPKRRPKPIITEALPTATEQAMPSAISTVASKSVSGAELAILIPVAEPFEDSNQAEGADAKAIGTLADEIQAPRSTRFAFSAFGPWIAGAAALLASLVALAWISSSLVAGHRLLPKPSELTRYVCTGRDATIYFRHDGNTIRMSSSAGTITGVLNLNKIEWNSEYTAAGKTLGFLPPTELLEIDVRSIRVRSGRSDDIDCIAPAGP